VRLAQNYNGPAGDASWYNADFNFDGVVDFNDLVSLAQNYNTSLPSAAQLASFGGAGFAGDFAAALAQVPEPGTVGGLALAGAAAMLRRRRRA
jgi:hypothetical protein